MSNITCETLVGEKLVEWLTKQNAQVLSFHPPSSKAYTSDLIRIPKLNRDGTRSRDRNHIDVVFLTENNVWLVELKCRYSESTDDINKLNEVKNSYSNSEIIELIKGRITVPIKYDLDSVKNVVTAIGVKLMDKPHNNEMPVFVVDENVEVIGWDGAI